MAGRAASSPNFVESVSDKQAWAGAAQCASFLGLKKRGLVPCWCRLQGAGAKNILVLQCFPRALTSSVKRCAATLRCALLCSRCADYVVLNKTDLMNQATVGSLTAIVESLNPLAQVGGAGRGGAGRGGRPAGAGARAGRRGRRRKVAWLVGL